MNEIKRTKWLKVVQILVVSMLVITVLGVLYWIVAAAVQSELGQRLFCNSAAECFTLPFLSEINQFSGIVFYVVAGSLIIFSVVSYYFLLPPETREKELREAAKNTSQVEEYDPYDVKGNIQKMLGLSGKSGALRIWKYKMYIIILLVFSFCVLLEKIALKLYSK